MTRDPLINILIRTTKGREKELEKCILSIAKQSYSNIKVIICCDDRENKLLTPNHETINYAYGLEGNLQYFFVTPTGIPYHWNFYCNNLKERVTDGWFFYLDDD